MNPVEALSAFQTLNRTRIERLSTLLPVKAHFFLEILPLLFQTNNPMLPGYISQATPIGIVNYQPNNRTLDAAKTINHTFLYKRHSLHHYPLRGLYLINDNGLLNYHADMPFELWLIYGQGVTAEELQLLQQKITAICDWANSFLKIKLNGRLLNDITINNDITPFDLDRLYLNGLLLAGLPPSWWSSPPAEKAQPLSTSQAATYDHNNALNFGDLTSTAERAQALLNRAVEGIDIAMDSNLTSCLTLIFQSMQLQHYGDFSWISEVLKRAIYAGDSEPMLLDSSHLKLNYITQFCNDPETLFFAQQSFYILSRERLSKTVNLATYSWRRTFIEQQYLAWQWAQNTPELIDQRELSHYRQSLNEYQAVRQQIINAMQAAFLFAQHHKLNIEKARQKLEKKFKILFNSDLDAIDCLPRSFKPHSHQDQLYLARTNHSSNWQINDMPANISPQPLYQHPSLLNILAWAVNNKLLTQATRIQFVDQRQKVKIAMVLDLIQQLLHSSLRTSSEEISTSYLGSDVEIETILLFANLEHQAISSLNQQGLDLASLQADPLNYANSRQSLIASVEGLIYTSWGHWHYVIHTGPTCLLELLGTIIQWQPYQQSALETTCWCPSDNHGKKISQRIETVYRKVIAHYIKHPLNGDYLITIADHFYRLQWQQGLVDILPLVKHKSLEQHLGEQRDIFSASQLDPLLDREGLFQLLLTQQVEKRISLFLLSKNNGVTLYIIDDLGTLFIQHTSDLTVTTLTNHYQHFFSQISVSSDVQFFHLTHTAMSGWKSTKITNFNIPTTKPTYLPVRVELDFPKENAQCIIHCGSKIFTGNINDPDLFKRVSDLVLSLRNRTSRYPLYINQLSFSTSKTCTTRHYIILKQKIENRLNKAENLSL